MVCGCSCGLPACDPKPPATHSKPTPPTAAVLVVRVWPDAEWELRSPTKNLDDGESAAFVS